MQSRNQDILATFKERFMVAPAVCPRLFECPATFTFGALRKNHIVSTTFEAIAKKTHKTETKKTIMNRQEHNRSSEGNDAWKKDLTSMAVPQNKTISVTADKQPRKGFISITRLVNAKKTLGPQKLTVVPFLLKKKEQKNS